MESRGFWLTHTHTHHAEDWELSKLLAFSLCALLSFLGASQLPHGQLVPSCWQHTSHPCLPRVAVGSGLLNAARVCTRGISVLIWGPGVVWTLKSTKFENEASLTWIIHIKSLSLWTYYLYIILKARCILLVTNNQVLTNYPILIPSLGIKDVAIQWLVSIPL